LATNYFEFEFTFIYNSYSQSNVVLRELVCVDKPRHKY